MIRWARFGFLLLFFPFLIAGTESDATEIGFDPAQAITTSVDRPERILARDIDGDGDLDVVAAVLSDDLVSWWENTLGDASSWAEHVVSNSYSSANSVAAEDLDGDGDLDLMATTKTYQVPVKWWENTAGDGSAWTEHTIVSSFRGDEILADDMDGDGDLDVIVSAADENEIAWWENLDGSATSWSKHSVASITTAFISASVSDMDGDGDIDVLAAVKYADEIAWWENVTGDGLSWSKHSVDSSFDNTTKAEAVDIDGDGDIDVIGAAEQADEIAWWENTAGGGLVWSKHSLQTGFNGAQSVHGADLDADGDMDVLGSAIYGDELSWWENLAGDGSSWSKHVLQAAYDGADPIDTGDLDNDGDLDVIGASKWGDRIDWWNNDTIHRHTRLLDEHTVVSSFGSAHSVHSADVDGDGDLDVLGTALNDDDISWFENMTGDGLAFTEHLVDGSFDGAIDVYTADVDSDGDLDIIGAAAHADDIAWWENVNGDGSTWNKTIVTGNLDYVRGIHPADIDGDGDIDIAAAAYFASRVVWFENTAGDGSAWSEHTVDSYFDVATMVFTADMDRDGDIDILATAEFAFDVSWWENTSGDGSTWSEHTIDGNLVRAQAVHAVDMDGDGDLDALTAAGDGGVGHIAWYENLNGQGTSWSKFTVDTEMGNVRSILGVDMDQDGDFDLLAGSYINRTLSWWENTAGDGSAWAEHTVDPSWYGHSVYAADVNGNGSLDLLATGNTANAIHWWEDRGCQFSMPTHDSSPSEIQQGASDDLLKLVARHHGRSGDADLELASIDLLFKDGSGNPMTSSQANDTIETLLLVRDDGSGVFEPGQDVSVVTVDTQVLVDGVQTVTCPDDDPNARGEFGVDQAFFVVIELTEDAPTGTISITHHTSDCVVENRDHDVPLTIEQPSNATASVEIVPVPFLLAVDPDPLVAGSWATFTVSGGKPFTRTWLAYSFTGPGSVYLPLLDVTLDIADPVQAGNSITTDSSGSGPWNLYIPPSVSGRDVWLQAVQYQNKTNLVATSIL